MLAFVAAQVTVVWPPTGIALAVVLLLAMLAHELRNPLAPISSAVETIRLSSGNVTRIAGMCDIMVRQIRHMGRLLDDLLDVSRITRGTIRLDKQAADLRTLVEHCLEPAPMLLEKKGVRLTTSIAAGPVPIRVDVSRMEQVITNLFAVTGYGSDADRQRALQAGFDALLVKPVDAFALQQSLAE